MIVYYVRCIVLFSRKILNYYTMKKILMLFIIAVSISGFSQNIEDIQPENFLKEIQRIDSLDKRIDINEERVRIKDSLVIKLNKKFEIVSQLEESTKKKYSLSAIAYELFTAESRLADEKIKLWQYEQFRILKENMDEPNLNEQVQDYVQNFINYRNSEAERLYNRSQEIMPYITEPLYLSQFNLFLESIKFN